MTDLFGIPQKQGFLSDDLSCNDHASKKIYLKPNRWIFKKNTVCFFCLSLFQKNNYISVFVSSIGQNSTKETLVSLAAPHFFRSRLLLPEHIRKSNIGHVAAFVATRLKEDDFFGRFQGEVTLEDGDFRPSKWGCIQEMFPYKIPKNGRISPGSNVATGMFFF